MSASSAPPPPPPPVNPPYVMDQNRVSPPTKKQRSTSTPLKTSQNQNASPDDIISRGDLLIAKRRQQLAVLQRQQNGEIPTKRTGLTSQELLARAEQQLRSRHPAGAHNEEPPMLGSRMPQQETMARVRHSDIFPSAVPKQTAPSMGSASGKQHDAQPSQEGGTLARRLDMAFSNGEPTDKNETSASRPRSKSAPPRRPPPPPPGVPPAATEAPAKLLNRTVMIQTPPKESIPQPVHTPVETAKVMTADAGHTPFPGGMSAISSSAGHTPFHGTTRKNMNGTAGHTPFPKSAIVEDSSSASTPVDTSTTPTKTNGFFAGHTPFPKSRDLDITDDSTTPPSAMSPELRLQQQLVSLQRDKQSALSRVSQLEVEVSRLRESKSMGSTQDLTAIVALAESEGEAAAVGWARQQVEEQKVSFLSPVVNMLSSPKRKSMASSPGRGIQRAPTPYKRLSPPKPRQSSPQEFSDQVELIMKAIEIVDHVYESENAIFTVRRPHGTATETDLWFAAGQLTNKLYEKQADIHEPTSLEVVASVKMDGSKLVVYGDAYARLQTDENEDWRNFGDVLGTDELLGTVHYIDENAEECEYSLDDLFEAANTVRYNYSTSILSTARGLKHRQPYESPATGIAPTEFGSPVQVLRSPFETPEKPDTSDMSVQTDTLTDSASPKRPAGEKKPTTQPKNVQPPEPEKDSNDDIVGQLMSMFFSFLLSSLYNLFIGIPFRILSTTFVIVMVFLLVAYLRVQFDVAVGAGYVGPALFGGPVLYNRAGIV